MTPPIINGLIGAAALLFGRRLFWLFVAAAGFVLGVTVAPVLLPNQPQWVILAAALVLGLLGAWLAMLVQQIAVGLAGFVFGGYILLNLLEYLRQDVGQWEPAVFILGGIIGALLVMQLLEPGLIVLSSLTGALLITDALPVTYPVDWAAFVVLSLVGMAFQAGRLKLSDSRSGRSANR